MKLLLTATAALLTTVSAFAADLPSKKSANAAPVAAGNNWTGFYAGVNAGGAWNRFDTTNNFVAAVASLNAIRNGLVATRLSDSKTGFTGGVQAGYNQQFDNVVFGVEADYSFLQAAEKISANTGTAAQCENDPGITCVVTNKSKAGPNWMVTVRARLGFSFDNVLVYGTGGLAVGGVKAEGSLSWADVPDQGFNALTTNLVTSTRSKTNWGWALGAGAEYAITSKWSAKAEYLHYDLGSVTTDMMPSAIGALGGLTSRPGTVKSSVSGDLARVGLNYKF